MRPGAPLSWAVDKAERIDKLLARRFPELGRAGARRLCAEGSVYLVSGERRRRAKKGEVAREGEIIELERLPDAAGAAPDDGVALAIVLATEAIVIVDKPAGVPSAALRAGERGTAASGLLARYPEMAAVGFSRREPGLCHRLDTATSGLLMAARTAAAFDEMTGAIRDERLDKRYLLVCPAAPLAPFGDEGVIDEPLASAGARVEVAPGGRPAHTRYSVLRRRAGLALVEARAARAQRHQIRVHFAARGAPLVGDALYGGDTRLLPHRHALHASHLGYDGGEHVAAFDVSSPLPAELERLLSAG